MACACSKRGKPAKFVWTDGTTTVVYPSEIQAKARVLRNGGTYTRQEG